MKTDSTTQSPTAKPLAPAHGSAWEYLVKHISGGPMPARELNKYGEEGWQLCGIASTPEPAKSMSNSWPDVMAYTFQRKTPNAPGEPSCQRPKP
jgi:hypothetical protein